MPKPIQLNTYSRLGAPNVTSTISVDEWLNQIKSSEHTELIITARKYSKDSVPYNAVKSALPCVTYNFLFDGYKNNNNIESSTGLLYIDIDEVSFNIEHLDKTKIFAYYKSFGGNGYVILVQVDGLTVQNYNDTYHYILNQLNLLEFYDRGAAKATQFNVLSYDEDIFINPDSFVFSAIQKVPNPCIIEKKGKAYTKRLGNFSNTIRFNDIDEITIDSNYSVFPEGKEIVKCFMPIKPITANRNNSLLAYCNNLIYLNPDLSIEATSTIMEKVNNIICNVPVDKSQLIRIVNSVFRYKENGTLTPIKFNKKRMVIFNKKFDAKPIEKLIIAGGEINKLKSKKSKQKIYDSLENWNFDSLGKITQIKLIAVSQLNKKTVRKYWSEFKDYVKLLNHENKIPSVDNKVINTLIS